VAHETPAVGGAHGGSVRRETVGMTQSTLFRGGQVYTPADPFATALLIDDGRVAWVGSDDASSAFAADALVDLDGALVTPAFVDAHVHTTATGLALTGLDLAGAQTLAEALAAVARHASGLPGDAVVLGHGWDETTWPEYRAPTAAELDRAAGGRPVYLSRADVHSAVVSSPLLAGLGALAGFDPSGHVTIDAHHSVRALALGTVTTAQREDAQRAARARAASLGIAALHECGGPDIAGEADFTALLALAAAESGPLVFGYWGELRAAGKARELGAVGAGGDLFVDGALGSHTAHLTTPYADRDSLGHAYLDAEEIAQHLVDCARLDVQAGFHAIGDAAIAAVLAGFAVAAEVVGAEVLRAGRHRLEHAELLDPELIAALAGYGVVASVQPGFDAAWGGTDGMYAERLGAERAASLNPFAALATAGVPLAFGSDAPVTPLGPWETVRAAVHHRTAAHRLSARAAFTAHTRGGWRAVGTDDTGILVPGAPAHLAVWEAGDLAVAAADERVARWSTDPASGVMGLPDLAPGTPLPTCLRTVVGGTTVYARE
jgi:predicted amidohydrolase YtcJ